MTEFGDIATILGLVATAVGLITIVVRVERRLSGIETNMEKQRGKMEARIGTLESKIEPFWELIKKNLPKLLSQNPSKMVLMKINQADTLSIEELTTVEDKLQKEMVIAPLNRRANFLLVISYLRSIRRGKEKNAEGK